MSRRDAEHPDENTPELDDDFFARARPAAEVMPPAFMTAVRSKGGRPRKADPKQAVNIRLEPAVLRHLRGRGRGWQTAVNDALAELIKLGRL